MWAEMRGDKEVTMDEFFKAVDPRLPPFAIIDPTAQGTTSLFGSFMMPPWSAPYSNGPSQSFVEQTAPGSIIFMFECW